MTDPDRILAAVDRAFPGRPELRIEVRRALLPDPPPGDWDCLICSTRGWRASDRSLPSLYFLRGNFEHGVCLGCLLLGRELEALVREARPRVAMSMVLAEVERAVKAHDAGAWSDDLPRRFLATGATRCRYCADAPAEIEFRPGLSGLCLGCMRRFLWNMACPACGRATLAQRNGYDICSFCNWEDDGQDTPNADEVFGGPNGDLSLTEARRRSLAPDVADPPPVRIFTLEGGRVVERTPPEILAAGADW